MNYGGALCQAVRCKVVLPPPQPVERRLVPEADAHALVAKLEARRRHEHQRGARAQRVAVRLVRLRG